MLFSKRHDNKIGIWRGILKSLLIYYTNMNKHYTRIECVIRRRVPLSFVAAEKCFICKVTNKCGRTFRALLNKVASHRFREG